MIDILFIALDKKKQKKMLKSRKVGYKSKVH